MVTLARPQRTLVLATTNRGKLAEFRALLEALAPDAGLEVCGLGDVLPEALPVDEDGATLADNAMKKACAAAQATGCLALADDSGLEVDALGGRPGVRSARFASDSASDAENIAALLAAIERAGALPPVHARFRCVLALVDPAGTTPFGPCTVEGSCDGTIAAVPRGRQGFGYDPVFVVAGMRRTMAELSSDEKNRVSHRARAVAALRPRLVDLARLARLTRLTPREGRSS